MSPIYLERWDDVDRAAISKEFNEALDRELSKMNDEDKGREALEAVQALARGLRGEEPPAFTVGSLIKMLQQSGVHPDTPVWLVGLHARPARGFEITTAGDPVSGRPAGHPDGPPVVVIE